MSKATKSKGSRRLQKYGRIIKYIEDYHPELHDVIDSLGMYNSFTPRKGCGVTFLIPSGNYLQKLIDTTYGETPEEAVQILKSLILLVTLKDTTDWDKMRDDVPNLLGHKLNIRSVDARIVKLKSGATLRADPNFQPMSSRPNMAIWNINGGEMDLEGQESEFKYVKSMRKQKTTKSKDVDVDDDRYVYALSVEKAYQRDSTVYLREMASLMLHLKNHRRDLYEIAQAMLDASARVSFYLIIEPYNCTGNNLIPRTVLDKWGLKSHNFPNAALFWRKVFNNLDSRQSDALIYSKKGRSQLRTAIDRAREKIVMAASPTSKTKKANSLYKELEAKNTIMGTGPVFSPHVHQIYKSRNGFKEWQDNARFLIRKYFDSYERKDLHEKLEELSGEDYARESIVTSTEFIKRGMSTAILSGLIEEFIDTDLLFYTPRIVSEWVAVKSGGDDDDDEESSDGFINFAAEELDFLDASKGGKGMSAEAIEDNLQIFKRTDPEGYKQLISKFKEARSAAASSAENSIVEGEDDE